MEALWRPYGGPNGYASWQTASLKEVPIDRAVVGEIWSHIGPYMAI